MHRRLVIDESFAVDDLPDGKYENQWRVRANVLLYSVCASHSWVL